MTQEELNRLVQVALSDMRLTRASGMWARLEVTQYGTPYVQVYVGFYNQFKEKEEYVAIRTYYMGISGPMFRTHTGG